MPTITSTPETRRDIEERAMLLWPRLDRSALRRCNSDPDRIADLVSRRTSLPPEAIRSLLVMAPVSEGEVSRWFG
ncbi:MAG: hypothetical protein WCK58_03355 [Chloroflexota bacterium]